MPRYVVFAGVNGSGKTTLYQSNKKIQDMLRVNVDEIVRGIGEWDNSKDVIKAGKIAVSQIKLYFSEKQSFNQETTLCDNSIIKNIMEAKKLGYIIELYYVGLDSADLAIDRVKNRVANGGHGIPDENIRKRYDQSIRQLLKVREYCDKIELYDNSKVFKRIAVYENAKWNLTTNDIPIWCKNIIK